MYYRPTVVRNHTPPAAKAKESISPARPVAAPRFPAAPVRRTPSPRPFGRLEPPRDRRARLRPPVGARRCRTAPGGFEVWRAPFRMYLLLQRSTKRLTRARVRPLAAGSKAPKTGFCAHAQEKGIQ